MGSLPAAETHSDMVLLHGGSPRGAERSAAYWADRRKVAQVVFKVLGLPGFGEIPRPSGDQGARCGRPRTRVRASDDREPRSPRIAHRWKGMK